MKFKNIHAFSLMPHRARFERKVEKGGDCWEWSGALKDNGYGYFRISANLGMISAHRAAWMLEFGDIPHGQYVCHKCDNRKCCRPDHLWLGTAKQNQQDMAAKGRVYSSQKKLSAEDKDEIRRLRSSGSSCKELAEKFGVQRPHISRVCNQVKEK